MPRKLKINGLIMRLSRPSFCVKTILINVCLTNYCIRQSHREKHLVHELNSLTYINYENIS